MNATNRKAAVESSSLARGRPSTDVTGKLELLMRSCCPFCGGEVYIARPAGDEHGMVAMHEIKDDDPEPCLPFNTLLSSDPARFTHEVMTRAGKEELEIFIARTEGPGLH
jgi:hypothetical protein